jgi:hypothetical protein
MQQTFQFFCSFCFLVVLAFSRTKFDFPVVMVIQVITVLLTVFCSTLPF